MKRKIVLLIAVILCMSLAACSKAPEAKQGPLENHTETTNIESSEQMQQQSDNSAQIGSTTEKTEEAIQQSIDLVGPWHLDSEKNDLAAFTDSLDLFPGYGEWGASMEIRGNGEMSWYIGAESWHGTYSVEENILHAQLTSDLEQSTQNWDLRITSESGIAGLEMDYRDMTIYWVHGDQEEVTSGNDIPSNWEKATEDEPWKVALTEDLFAKYGVIPEYYEDLGDGIYQVYVEVGGEIVPFVVVNSATGDYHG